MVKHHLQAFRRVLAAVALVLALCCPALAGDMPFPLAAGGTVSAGAAGDIQTGVAGHIETGAPGEMGSGVAGDVGDGVSPAVAVLALLRVILGLP